MNILDKARLLQSSMLTGIMLTMSVSAYAQTTTTVIDPITGLEVLVQNDDDQFEERGEEIIVTGSRLRRNEFTSASPLQVIDGELARDLGLVDAADLLGQTTVVQGQQITTGVSTSAGLNTANGPGSATASLRGLSSDRTLVLINGRRLAPAGVRGAPSAPDLNLIPGTLIKRVDVLLDGASSVYGSDAVAGVVNYVLRDDFDGIQLDAYATMPEFAGNAGHQEVFTATAGISNDKGFIGFAVEHSETDGFTERAVSDFYSPYAGGCVSRVTIGASGTIYEPDLCSGSFGAGSAISPVGFVGYSAGANIPGLAPNFVPIRITADLIQPDNLDGQRLLLFPEELDASFTPDFERNTIYSIGEYDTGLYGDMTAYFEASYAQRITKTNTSGQGAVEVPGSYVLNPFGGGTTLFYGNRFVNDTDVAQTRLIGGLRGDLPFLENAGLKNWGYDMYVSHSRSSGQDKIKGIPFLPRLEQTLANTRIDADGNTVCDPRVISGESQVVECRPLDFFNPTFLFTGRFDDEADNEYLFPNRLTSTEVEQTVYSAYVSGDMFDIPTGGTVIVGLGGEYRKDQIETDTSLAGDFLGFTNDPGSNGSRSLKEVFGEIEIPLIKDRPLIHELTVNGAARFTEEDNFGSEVTYSIKGQYAPTDWLSFRGTYGTSFRAPNLGEQFGGRVTGFSNPNDPCRTPGVTVPFSDFDNDPSTPETRNYDASFELREQTVLQNCLNGGGPFNLEATDPFSLGIRGIGGTSPVFLGAPTLVASGSNPNLKAETSDAFSVGGVFDQPWLDAIDLKLSVTYFEIEIQDEVDSLSAAVITNRCYNSPGLTDPTCQFITRDPRVAGVPESGEISFVSALNQNLGTQIVQGIDYNAEFGFDVKPSFLSSPVDYNLIARATQSLKQDEDQITVDGIDVDDDLGEYGNPKWRISLTNQLRWEDFSFLFQSRYIGSQVEDNADPEDPVTTFFSNCRQAGDFTDDVPCLQYDGLEDYWVHSASVGFSRDTYVLRFGVNNVFDTAPPLTDNNNLGSLGGIGYDLNGRTYFANVTKKF